MTALRIKRDHSPGSNTIERGANILRSVKSLA